MPDRLEYFVSNVPVRILETVLIYKCVTIDTSAIFITQWQI